MVSSEDFFVPDTFWAEPDGQYIVFHTQEIADYRELEEETRLQFLVSVGKMLEGPVCFTNFSLFL